MFFRFFFTVLFSAKKCKKCRIKQEEIGNKNDKVPLVPPAAVLSLPPSTRHCGQRGNSGVFFGGEVILTYFFLLWIFEEFLLGFKYAALVRGWQIHRVRKSRERLILLSKKTRGIFCGFQMQFYSFFGGPSAPRKKWGERRTHFLMCKEEGGLKKVKRDPSEQK